MQECFMNKVSSIYLHHLYDFTVYPTCHVDEFACSNGQCIASTARCDLVGDCVTNSDEEMCGKLNEERNVMVKLR